MISVLSKYRHRHLLNYFYAVEIHLPQYGYSDCDRIKHGPAGYSIRVF